VLIGRTGHERPMARWRVCGGWPVARRLYQPTWPGSAGARRSGWPGCASPSGARSTCHAGWRSSTPSRRTPARPGRGRRALHRPQQPHHTARRERDHRL